MVSLKASEEKFRLDLEVESSRQKVELLFFQQTGLQLTMEAPSLMERAKSTKLLMRESIYQKGFQWE